MGKKKRRRRRSGSSGSRSGSGSSRSRSRSGSGSGGRRRRSDDEDLDEDDMDLIEEHLRMKIAAMAGVEEGAVAAMMISLILREQGQDPVPGVVLMRRTLVDSLWMRKVALLSERKPRESTSSRTPKGS